MSLLLSGLALWGFGAAQAQVSVRTLVPQMSDLTILARRASPSYTTAQASSYDRKSKDRQTDWFANGDAGQFIRSEMVGDRREWVMADLRGPGAVVRVWSANPKGVIRFYFDGESTPRIEAKMRDLLTGKVKPFSSPFAYDASSGTNLYFPLPYATSLKVTSDESEGPNSLYYHVGYRTYPTGTTVATYSPSEVADAAAEIEAASTALGDNPRGGFIADADREQMDARVDPKGKTVVFQKDGMGAVFELRATLSPQSTDRRPWKDPLRTHNLLRNTILFAEFDGEPCIAVPLGDFFGTAPGLTAYSTLPMRVTATGDMSCRFVMPFAKSAKIWLENWGSVPVYLSFRTTHGPFEFTPNTYHFKAQWGGENARTRPMRDMNFLDVKGEGTWLGSVLQVGNPVPDWWGEGDEKAFVDGEAFPSTFGTGTEDYYGYAWGSANLFQKAYHAQPRCDGPGLFGHTTVMRWHVFDDIPFTSSFEFDLEMWHWADCLASFLHTAYWYGKPGGTGPIPIDRKLLPPIEYTPPEPVKGAIEGEKLEVVSKSGGKTEAQEGFFGLSNGAQLWWTGAKPSDKLVLKVPVPSAGRYRVVGNFCFARDYGIQQIAVNGKAIKQIDFYGEGVSWKKLDLGTFDLPAGSFEFTVDVKGKNPKAVDGYMFGLDYLLLQKAN